MEEDLGLPTPPQLDPALPIAPSYFSHNGRKRSARNYELQDEESASSALNTSSDPALFSSDETPDAENYSGLRKRQKRKYKGTWWGEKQNRKRSSDGEGGRTKRKFTRNFDSGVFMASDDGSTELSSDSSFYQDFIEEQITPKPLTRALPVITASPMRRKFKAQLSYEANDTSNVQSLDPKQQYVRDIILRCLEHGKEDVDLSGLGLEDTKLELKDLRTLVRIGSSTELQGPLHSLEAQVRLYLGNNELTQIPPDIFYISNLRLLSLRQNNLTHIPGSIRGLTKLQILNVSGNNLSSLPYEVLDLIKNHSLVEIISEPNPWLRCAQAVTSFDRCPDYHNDDKHTAQIHWDSRRIASSDTQEVDCVGRFLETRSRSIQRPRAPHLSEVILRQLRKLNTSYADIKSLMPSDTSENVLKMLQNLEHEAGSRCIVSDCQREIVIPRRKWTEWWDVKCKKPELKHEVSSSRSLVSSKYEPQIIPFELHVCGQCNDDDFL